MLHRTVSCSATDALDLKWHLNIPTNSHFLVSDLKKKELTGTRHSHSCTSVRTIPWDIQHHDAQFHILCRLLWNAPLIYLHNLRVGGGNYTIDYKIHPWFSNRFFRKEVYTGCPRRNVPHFGRVFLMLKYTDITQNTYVQSWTVTEIKEQEKCGLLAVPRTVPGSRDVIPIRCALSVLVYSWLKLVPRWDCTCKVLGNPKDNYDVSASVFVVQFNGFMSLTS